MSPASHRALRVLPQSQWLLPPAQIPHLCTVRAWCADPWVGPGPRNLLALCSSLALPPSQPRPCDWSPAGPVTGLLQDLGSLCFQASGTAVLHWVALCFCLLPLHTADHNASCGSPDGFSLDTHTLHTGAACAHTVISR